MAEIKGFGNIQIRRVGEQIIIGQGDQEVNFPATHYNVVIAQIRAEAKTETPE